GPAGSGAAAVGVDADPVDAPRVDGHADGVGEAVDRLPEAVDDAVPDGVQVPAEVAVEHPGLVGEAVDLHLLDATVGERAGDDAARGRPEVDGQGGDGNHGQLLLLSGGGGTGAGPRRVAGARFRIRRRADRRWRR